MLTTRHRQWVVRSGADFGRTIADLRAARGLTQADLARKSGVSRQYVADLERGVTVLVLERMLRMFRRLGAEVTVTARADVGASAGDREHAA